jgi:hypothetical protein
MATRTCGKQTIDELVSILIAAGASGDIDPSQLGKMILRLNLDAYVARDPDFPRRNRPGYLAHENDIAKYVFASRSALSLQRSLNILAQYVEQVETIDAYKLSLKPMIDKAVKDFQKEFTRRPTVV